MLKAGLQLWALLFWGGTKATARILNLRIINTPSGTLIFFLQMKINDNTATLLLYGTAKSTKTGRFSHRMWRLRQDETGYIHNQQLRAFCNDDWGSN